MALKDIFKMTKANRYTADGREELIKAQEAVTEDRRYNIGEISEKTGLQKTANGWVKPKSGKQPGMNKMTSWGTPSEPSENVKHLKDPNPGIPSQGNDIAINGKAYKAHLGDTILTKSGQKYEYAGKTSTGKIRVTSREGSTPITTAIDEKEILGLSEPENMSPKEKAALRTAENNTESKPAEKPILGNGNEKWKKQRDHWNEEHLHMDTPQGDQINIYQKKNGDFVVYTKYRGTDMVDQSKPFKTSEEAQAFGESQADNLSKKRGKVNGTFTDGEGYTNVTFGDRAPTSDSALRVLTGDTRIRVRK